MARVIEPAGWVTDSGNGPYGTEMEAKIAEVLEWLDIEARKARREAYADQMDGKKIQSATKIGREWAFYRAMSQLQPLIEFDPVIHERGL